MKDWVRLYTSAWSNKKFLGLSLEAHGLWAIGLAYSGGSEREGFVPTELAERVTRYGCDQSVTEATTPAGLAEQLVSSGLWEPIDGGWMMHNYDGRQAKDEASREANRIRQQRFRDTRRATDNGHNADVTPATVTSHPREEEKREEKRRLTPKPPKGAVPAEVLTFTEVWNANCGVCPVLRKPPQGVPKQRPVLDTMTYVDGDVVVLAAAIRRYQADEFIASKGYGFETFCRHPERWVVAARPVLVPDTVDMEAERLAEQRRIERRDFVPDPSVPSTPAAITAMMRRTAEAMAVHG